MARCHGRKSWELLAVNRLIAPRSELSIHEKWFPQTAMAALLDSEEPKRIGFIARWIGWSSIRKP